MRRWRVKTGWRVRTQTASRRLGGCRPSAASDFESAPQCWKWELTRCTAPNTPNNQSQRRLRGCRSTLERQLKRPKAWSWVKVWSWVTEFWEQLWCRTASDHEALCAPVRSSSSKPRSLTGVGPWPYQEPGCTLSIRKGLVTRRVFVQRSELSANPKPPTELGRSP